MQKTDIDKLRRLHEAAISPDCTGTEYNYFTRHILNAIPALLDEIETARRENATMRATIISAMVDVQHNLPGNGHAKLSLLLDGIMKAPRNNEERLLEEVRRLTQANADIRKERDRAVKEAQRQHGAAKVMRRQWVAAREEVREVQNGAALQARDRRMKLIGAAEKLEQLGCELNYMTSADMKAIAAKLRQEAEG